VSDNKSIDGLMSAIPLMRRNVKEPVVFLFWGFFALYMWSSYPTVHWSDAGEFITASFELGVTHPAGSPFYLPAVKLFTFLPFGSIAFRITLASAFFGAILVSLIYKVTLQLLRDINQGGKDPTLASMFTAILFGLSDVAWFISGKAEVYTLQHVFFLLVILLIFYLFRTQSTGERGRGFQFANATIFLSALALGAHITFFFYFPAILMAFIWVKRKEGCESVNEISSLIFFFILGCSVYLYLPIRAATDPYFNWGEPESLKQFLIHVSDRKDASYHFNLFANKLPGQFLLFGKLLLEQFTSLGIILILAGGFRLWREKRVVLLFLLFLALPNFLFFIRYWSNGVAYVPTFLCLALLLGVGMHSFLSFLERISSRFLVRPAVLKTSTTCLLIGVLVLSFAFNIREHAKQDYWITRDIFRSILSEVKPNAIVISQLYYFPLSYIQEIERWRPDVTVMSKSDFYAPHQFRPVTQERFPGMIVPQADPLLLLPELIKANVRERPMYWEPKEEDDAKLKGHLIPSGFLYRISEQPVNLAQVSLAHHEKQLQQSLDQAFRNPVFFEDPDGGAFYQTVFSRYSTFFVEQDLCSNAQKMVEVVSLLKTEIASELNNLGTCYARRGSLSRAKELFEASLQLNNENVGAWTNLGQLYLKSDRFEEAKVHLERALHLEPQSAKANYFLGRTLAGLRHYPEAVRAYEKGLASAKETELINELQKELSDLKGAMDKG
jgi:tetratricopeptide (TPR) repeat protein